SCFVTTHHAAVQQNPGDAVLADAAHFGARFESAYGLVELPGGLASRWRRHRVDPGGHLAGLDLPLPRRDGSERLVRCRIRPGISPRAPDSLPTNHARGSLALGFGLARR